MTCKREDIEKGFEPDKCFYVQNEPQMWHKMEVDLAVDPPPDLAIEDRDLRSSVKKMLRFMRPWACRKSWRFDGQILRIYELIEANTKAGRQVLASRIFRSPRWKKFLNRSAKFARRHSCAGSASGCGRSLRRTRGAGQFLGKVKVCCFEFD